MFQQIREFFFLPLANNLPRLKVLDSVSYIFYKWAGLKVKGKCRIFGPLIIRPIGKANKIEIGTGSFLNTEIRFGCPDEKVVIGRNCLIGPRVCFETMNHNLRYEEGERRGGWSKSIILEDEVWIGCGVIILQGVTIGKGAVVAAGSVVNRDIPPHTIFGGVPAKFIKVVE